MLKKASQCIFQIKVHPCVSLVSCSLQNCFARKKKMGVFTSWTFGLLGFFLFLFFLFLLFLLSLFFLLGFLVLPDRRFQVTLLPFVLFLLLWSALPRFCNFNFGNAAWGEDAVSVCHAAGDEAFHATCWWALPALWVLAARGQWYRGGRHRWSWSDGAITVRHHALLQFLAAVLVKQFRYSKSSLANLWGAGGTEWTATSSYQGAVDACSHPHHVVHDPIVLGVMWEAETKTVF